MSLKEAFKYSIFTDNCSATTVICPYFGTNINHLRAEFNSVMTNHEDDTDNCYIFKYANYETFITAMIMG